MKEYSKTINYDNKVYDIKVTGDVLELIITSNNTCFMIKINEYDEIKSIQDCVNTAVETLEHNRKDKVKTGIY